MSTNSLTPAEPTSKNIMELMEAKGVKGLTIAIVKSHKQVSFI